ncbi:hypothetical protein K438DRAFT_1991796 [Mycena galopus ATCC 62051]|nr:hypothetical protein K438DRAFT_1991796 [Mycena galopus ATCC 62051]
MSSTALPSSSPPRASSPVDDEDDYAQLMLNATPVLCFSSPMGIIFTAFATRKRLHPEQISEVEGFVNDPPAVQLAKIFVTLKANENVLATFQAAKPQFEINTALKTNITRAVNAMLCSSKITQYKGETAKSNVQTLLLRHRWGNFVVGTEHDKFSMDTIMKFIRGVFMQSRLTVKKESNLSSSKGRSNATQTLRTDATHSTIYQLTKVIVQKLCSGKKISIPITPVLCA